MSASDSVDNLAGCTVLVVDDSKTIRKSAEALLARAGCRVITAGDGFEALAMIASGKPDVILVDIMMPRLDGYQTCALIKNNPSYRHVPVIMLSSKDGVFDRARGYLAGSQEYLTKPFTRDELVGSVRRHAGKSAGKTEQAEEACPDKDEVTVSGVL